MDDKISVVITCYNHGLYIEQCLTSVFAQTYKNIELLVINDGSTDNSDEIITKMLKDSPFKKTEYIKQENAGICVTRNRGLDWISGDFVLFVDSDNYLDADYLEKLMAVADLNNADIIYANLVDPETNEVFMQTRPYDLQEHLKSNYIDNCSLIRVAKIGDTRYDLALNRKKLVDYDFMLNLVINQHAKPYQATNTKVNYRVLDDSISRQNTHKSEKFYYEVYFYILSKYFDKEREKVVLALKENVFHLEDRLTDLINHLGDVTVHIHNQEDQIRTLLSDLGNKERQYNAKMAENEQLTRIVEDSNTKMNELENKVNTLEIINAAVSNEKEQIINSTSYRLGDKIVKPIHYAVKIIRNPRLTRKALGKIKRKILFKVQKFPSFKGYCLSVKRNLQRKRNNYTSPNRVLIYVIYEGQDHLQEYKLIFLQELAKLSKQVLIVVNGTLPADDLENLAKVGEVECRENSGYDTAAFRYGVEFLGKETLSKFDELLLVNDTNVGPFTDLQQTFNKMGERRLDFWGVSYGEHQNDFTGYNKYGVIPIHLQSYFLVIEKSLLTYQGFYDYWKELGDTDSREKAIGKHETVFTKHFGDLGFKHGALAKSNEDSPMYIHPLSMVQEGIPIVKYTAFANYNDDKFAWQGLIRKTEVPELLTYIEQNTDYPMSAIHQIMDNVYNNKVREHILIIDGVENVIPQCTRYRVTNKAEQLRSAGYDVWTVNASAFQMGYAEHASHIIIYRTGYTDQFGFLCQLARKYNKPVYYDIDDLVIDTKYTDQLEYTKTISSAEKANYDAGVKSYGQLLKICDGAITTTAQLKHELQNYQSKVLINRNLASKELIEISAKVMKDYRKPSKKVKIGYFSGSITHNENFELVKPALLKLLATYSNVELHLVGHLDVPAELAAYKQQVVTHEYVEWHELPSLVSEVDINLAPLVHSIFNEAKSEIKWLEAALVKVPTMASNIGSFVEMIENDVTGILVDDSEWFEKLEQLVLSSEKREEVADAAYRFVLKNCVTEANTDELIQFVQGE